MKSFINVLYRRILYKIPLKLLLILIAIFGILFACFSSADYLDGLQFKTNVTYNSSTPYSVTLSTLGFSDSDSGLVCFNINNFNGSKRIEIFWYQYNNIRYSSEATYRFNLFGCFSFSAGQAGNYSIYIRNSDGNAVGFDIDFYYLPVVDIVSGNPGYTSLECQTEYNLIPISSVDQNYCTTNNLCPSQECPSVPIGSGNLTQLYINNILHVGAPTILMDIPEEIDWDYAYTQGGNIMNIDIVGYNVDYDKINEQINLQNFKPSSEDLSKVVSGIIPLFVPGLCIILLLYFIFKFIKKIF